MAADLSSQDVLETVVMQISAILATQDIEGDLQAAFTEIKIVPEGAGVVCIEVTAPEGLNTNFLQCIAQEAMERPDEQFE